MGRAVRANFSRVRRGALLSAMAVTVVAGLVHCSAPTQIVLQAYTDVAWSDGRSVTIAATDGPGEAAAPSARTAAPWPQDGRIGSLVVVSDSGQDGVVSVRAVLATGRDPASCRIGDAQGCIIARRRLRFVPERTLRVPLTLHARCAGVACDEATTCNALGACVPAELDASRCASEEECLPDGDRIPGAVAAEDAGADASADAGVDASPPARREPLIMSGAGHTCARWLDGVVKCWGHNDMGQLGLGHVTDIGGAPGQMGSALAAVDLGEAAHALSPSGQSSHTCALLAQGRVKCWGRNDSGQLGLGDTVNRGAAPGQMGAALPVVDLGPKNTLAVVVGGYHTCALASPSLRCWGRNDFGQLGRGDTVTRGSGPGQMGSALTPIDFGAGRGVVAVAAGVAHTCALLDTGRVRCFGRNDSGQLGLGDTTHRCRAGGETPAALPDVDLGPGRTATSIASGGTSTCAVLDDGSVRCWGRNIFGQLGLGDMRARGDEPGEMGAALPAVDLGPGRKAVQLAAGGNHMCALLDDGSARCWGLNNYGQLGLGDNVNRGAGPGQMGALLAAPRLGGLAIGVTAGEEFSCATLGDGRVKCWGDNRIGQLGLGDTDGRGDQPADMAALPDVALGK